MTLQALRAGTALRSLVAATRYLLRNGRRGKTETLTELKGYLEKCDDGKGKACKYDSTAIASSPSKVPAPPPEVEQEEAAVAAIMGDDFDENELVGNDDEGNVDVQTWAG